MATRAMTGFELNNAAAEGFDLTGSVGPNPPTIVSSPTAGAWSSYAARVNIPDAGDAWIQLYNRSTTTGLPDGSCGQTTYVRFKIRFAALPASGSEVIYTLYTAIFTKKLALKISSAGVLSSVDTSGGTLTGTATLSTNTWYRIEVKVGSGAGGAIEWKVDGTIDKTGTGTINGSDGCFNLFGSDVAVTKGYDAYFDDILVSDSAYPGDGGVMLLIPDANGTYQDFSVGAGSGSHYQVVGVVPPNAATSYLVSTAQNQAETESMQPSSAKPISSTINCVLPISCLQRDVSTTTAILRLVSGGNNYDSSSVPGIGSMAGYAIPRDTDPATSAAWTTSGIDAVQVGAVDNHASRRLRLAGAFLMVDAVPASAPTNSVAPAVTGTAQVGQTLTCSQGTWTGSPTSYAYQWQRADDSGFTTNVTNIGSNQNTFVLTASESGKYARSQVTATNAGGSTTANSNVVGAVLPAAPTNSVAPSCSPSSGTTADNFVFSSGTWTGSPTSWSWEYRAQGSSGAWTQFSTSQNPTVAGSTFGAGTWDTRLTATNAGGSATANGTQITVTVPVTARPSALLMAGVGP